MVVQEPLCISLYAQSLIDEFSPVVQMLLQDFCSFEGPGIRQL